MAIEVRPATVFEDVQTMVGPKRPDATVCWCLSYRLGSSRENRELVGPDRGERVRLLVQQRPPPGVLAYDGDEVVGWAAVHPRADTSFARNRKIPHVDDLDVWSVWCIRVRPGHRKEGISHHLLAGAVAFARANGAVAIEGYPLDNQGARIDSDHGLRRHDGAVPEGRLRRGGRHRLGAERLPPSPDATRPSLSRTRDDLG